MQVTRRPIYCACGDLIEFEARSTHNFNDEVELTYIHNNIKYTQVIDYKILQILGFYSDLYNYELEKFMWKVCTGLARCGLPSSSLNTLTEQKIKLKRKALW